MKRRIIPSFLFLLINLLCFSQNRLADSINNDNKSDSGYVISKDSLNKIIKQQNQDIAEFRSLQEEMTAKNVFEKSKSYLIWWISMSGIVILVVTIFGFSKTKDYVIKVLKHKIDTESSTIINEFIKKNVPFDKIAKEIENKGIEKLNELIIENKKSFDELVDKSKVDFQDFSRQLEESRKQLKNPLGENIQTENNDLAEQIPAKIDYTSSMNPVRNQGELGSVIGFAMASCMEYFIQKQLNKKVILSPLFIYYEARKIAGNEKTDSGAFIKDAIKVAQMTGIVLEKAWPYKINKFAEEPPKSIDKTPHYFIVEVVQVSNTKQIKNALAKYGPVIIGMTVYSSFLTTTSGMVKIPTRKDTINGGISICIVGYDDKTELFKFKHSWGNEWGEKGYGFVPYEYIEKFSDDGWTIKSVKEKDSVV